MFKKILSLVFLVGAAMALPQVEYSGNHTGAFKEALAEVGAESASHATFTLPMADTQVVVWSHLGEHEAKKSPEEIEALVKFVSDGGVLILASAAPGIAFPMPRAYDLTPAAVLLGARSYVYGAWEAGFQGGAEAVLGADANVYTDSKQRGPGLSGLCGMRVLLGTDKVAFLGINRIGDGAVIYTRAEPTNPAYAAALRRLITVVLSPDERANHFPAPTGNRAARVGDAELHLALSFDNEKSALDNLLPRLLGDRNYFPLAGEDFLTVHVGRTPFVESLGLDFDSLHPFGYYIILHEGRHLILAGKTSQGTNFAVVDFLKRYLGYRRFGGDPELFEITPQHETLRLPATLKIREEPSIHSYTLAWGGGTGTFGRNGRLTCQATHALDSLVPPKKYGQSHPEYFPMINGKRVVVSTNGTLRGPWNPCVSHPDIPKLVAEYADEYFAKHPDRLGLPMGVNDGGGDCQCPDCGAERAETGNQYARFYNVAAKVLAERHPDKLVSFIAYSAAAGQAPRGVQLEPNILVEITGMGKSVYECLEVWRAAGVKHFGIYDYLYPFASGYVTPRHYPRVMAGLWREAYAKYGIKTMWMEYYPNSTIFDGARQYVLDEIAWNIEADVEALLDDYFTTLYAGAATPVKRFFDLHEKVYARKAKKEAPIHDWKSYRQMAEYTRDDLALMDEALEEAGGLVGDGLPRRRFELLEKAWLFSRQRIEMSILTHEVESIAEIQSEADAKRVMDLVERGYVGIAAAAAFTMEPEDERQIFYEGQPKSGLAALKNFSRLLPLPNFELACDPALGRLTAWLQQNDDDVAAYYRRAVEGVTQEGARAALLTQSYMLENELVNLVKNPSFEEQHSEEVLPIMSDHVALKNVPGWSSWTFPSSVTRFFINDKVARSGNYSAAIGELQIGGSLISYVALKPYCRYRLTFWVRRNRGNEGFGMGSASIRMQGRRGWLDAGSAIVVPYPEDCENEWRQCSVSFTAPSEPATALLLLAAPKQAPGAWTAFDDVSLEVIYQPEDLEQRLNRLVFIPPVELETLPQTRQALATARELVDSSQHFLPHLEVTLRPDAVGPDGAFDIAFENGKMTISGSDEGLRCGLYTLLQTLGFHWFNPQEKIVLPQTPVEADLVALEGQHRPSFSYRGLHICGVKHQFDEQVARWMSYNRMNRKLTHLPQVDIIGERLNELGLRPDTTVHAYSLLISDQKYYQDHPEFFALVGGKRIRQSEGGQLCLSNREMRKAFADELLKIIADKPELGVYGFCPNDGYGHCECEACLALDTDEDRAQRLVNRRVADFVQDICARVAKVAPKAMLGHYSYSNFSRFLDHLDEPPKNLMVSCTMFHCYSHSVFDPECPINPQHAARLKDIRAKVDHVYIYDYFSHNWGQLPAPYWGAVIRDFQEYRRLGVDGWMSECGGVESKMWSSQWSTYYLAARSLWAPYRDVESFINELCHDRYGQQNPAAAVPMERYYRALQRGAERHDICLDKRPDYFKEFFTPQVQAECAAALKAAGNSPFVRQESELFELQRQIYRDRERYVTPPEITAGRLDGDPQPLYLVDRASQLPNLENDTQVWVAADATRLRFRFLMHEQKMGQLKTKSGNPYEADSIELFIDDGINPKVCYHYLFGPNATMSASECEGPRWNWAWEHGAQVKAQRHAAAWELEVEIPRADVGATGDSFGFTVIRNRYPDGWQIYGTPAGGAYFKQENYIRCRVNTVKKP